jgi:hypothetical protein
MECDHGEPYVHTTIMPKPKQFVKENKKKSSKHVAEVREMYAAETALCFVKGTDGSHVT